MGDVSPGSLRSPGLRMMSSPGERKTLRFAAQRFEGHKQEQYPHR